VTGIAWTGIAWWDPRVRNDPAERCRPVYPQRDPHPSGSWRAAGAWV